MPPRWDLVTAFFRPEFGIIRSVLLVEIYRSHDGRWTIERAVDRYLIYDEESSDPSEEVCRLSVDGI
jgi:hypothetical protein